MTSALIKLKITPAAKALLLRHLAEIEYDAIASVLWTSGGSETVQGVMRSVPPHWCVGFYDSKDVPPDEIQNISGIRIIFGQRPMSERLNGKVLDERDGHFIVVDDDT